MFADVTQPASDDRVPWIKSVPDVALSNIVGSFFELRIWGVRRISLAGDRRGLFEVVKQDVRRGRLHAKLTQHPDDLAAV